MKSSLQSYMLASVIGVFTLGTGVATLVQTDFAARGEAVYGGLYQRAVEDRFNAVIPMRDLSANVFAAIKLGVFGQTSDGAMIAESGRLFTTEELVSPTSEFSFRTELASAHSALDAMGIALVPVIVPDKARIYAQDLGRARSDDLIARYGVALNTITEMGLTSPDLRDAFYAGTSNGDVFMRTDTHWSPQGAELAAKQIAETLKQHPAERQEFLTLVLQDQPFRGDLISYADTGPFQPFVGPQTETLPVIETTAVDPVDDLFGDVEIPVALVGTSYSARTEFNFEGYLKQETGLDLINYAVSGTGPFAPMRDFLNSDDLKSTPPQIVIWEIPERYIAVKDSK